MPEAKSVWMEIEGDSASQHVKLQQTTTQPRLWFAQRNVMSGHSYSYGAKVSKWLFGLGTAKIFEDGLRVIKKNAIHRDIFTSVENKIVDRIGGYKCFLQHTVSTITEQETPSDFQVLLSEYFQLHHSNLQLAYQHELGRFAIECASEVVLHPSAAAFVVYYLSIIYDNVASLPFSNIQGSAASRLLNTLAGWPLQQYLGAYFSPRITETMSYLVKVCSGRDNWDSFVLWCYPSLSSGEILKLFKPAGYRPTPKLVKTLCSYVGRYEGTEQILNAIIPHIPSLSTLCQVIGTLSLSLIHI